MFWESKHIVSLYAIGIYINTRNAEFETETVFKVLTRFHQKSLYPELTVFTIYMSHDIFFSFALKRFNFW